MEILLLLIAGALVGIYLFKYYRLSKKPRIHTFMEKPEKKKIETKEKAEQQKMFNKDATKSVPNSVEAKMLYSKAMTFYKRGELEEASRLFIQVISLDQSFLDANNKLGIIYLKQEQHGKAEAIFRQLIAKSDNEAVYYSNLGRAQYGQNKLEEALESYLKAIRIDDSRPGRQMSAGRIYLELGNSEKAQEMFRKAIELDPENIDYLLTFADFLLEENKHTQAVHYLDKVIELQPDNKIALEMKKKAVEK